MSDPVGSVTQTQAAVQVADVREKAPEPRIRPVPVDKVQLSSAAQAALQEASDTPTQTEKDADTSDVQSQALLAQQAQALLDQQDVANAEIAQADRAHTHVVA